MVPISHDCWLERKMDNPESYRNLLELVQDIVHVFGWFNHDHNLDRMRGGFNWLVDKYVEFESAANLRREQNGVLEISI
jgi:hypothetical protein